MKTLYSKLYFAFCIGMMFLLLACGGEDDKVVLSITPAITDYSAASGDAMGLYVVEEGSLPDQTKDKIYNMQYTYNGSAWSTTGKTQWPDITEGKSYKFYAYAPYNAGIYSITNYQFSCPVDQSTQEQYKKADFILATSTVQKQSTPVSLNMSHLFSKITVNIKYGKNIEDILSGLTISAVNSATINMNTGEAFSYGNQTKITPVRLATAASGYVKSFSCIIPTQTIDNSSFITLNYNDGTSSEINFTQTLSKGENYSINLSVIGKKEVVMSGFSVLGWDDEVIYNGGGTLTKNKVYETGDIVDSLISKRDKAATLVLIGDGFTKDDLVFGGLYETKAREGMDFLFNVEPFKTYKDYFNVYIIAAESAQSGADSLTSRHYRNTYFNSGWGDDSYDNMSADGNKIYDFVTKYCPDIVKKKATIDDVTIFLLINDHRYGGMTYINDSGRGFAMCPLTSGSLTWAGNTPKVTGYSTGDWRNTLVHEGGGHGFGRLTDEYWYDDNATFTGTSIDTHSWTVPFGKNVTNDVSSTSNTYFWKHMVGTTIFPKEGAYEGADGYGKGLYRPEIISCMIDNRRYFNAYSRQLIVERIMKLCGETFNYDTFLSKDVNYDEILDSKGVIHTYAFSRAMTKIYPPLPHPRLIRRK